MRSGKLAPEVLQRLVLGRLGVHRPDVLVHAALGEDAAAISASVDEALVLTSDPITGAAANAGWYAVHVNCNDLAAMGAQPIGVLATLLAAAADGAALVTCLRAAGHQAAVIGRLTDGPERILVDGASRRPAGPVVRDELWRIREEWNAR